MTHGILYYLFSIFLLCLIIRLAARPFIWLGSRLAARPAERLYTQAEIDAALQKAIRQELHAVTQHERTRR